ncbi:cupin domain-containing protein [Robiginitalea sp. M366]|uniref:cupin domain-containing protein n=1 Tax=Robiginitalea aestuariiviva TaxID=3036903 RepID=UPI00240D308B|nr:cupin domain-containing protein [Robiginitalea aestuariiviva]MDG1573228.1 cupin domain-containing protein [Robiginitalea aestuariiviva]
MKTYVNRAGLCVLAVLALWGCREKSPEPQPEAMENSTEMVATEAVLPALDPSLDPMMVGEAFSQPLGDTLNIQMYIMTMKPGDSIGLHQHLDHTAYVLKGGQLLVYVDGTEPVQFVLNEGQALISGPLTDAAVNNGDTEVSLLINEIHRPRE